MNRAKGTVIALGGAFLAVSLLGGCATYDDNQNARLGQSFGNVVRDLARETDNPLIRSVGDEAPRVFREVGRNSGGSDDCRINDRETRDVVIDNRTGQVVRDQTRIRQSRTCR